MSFVELSYGKSQNFSALLILGVLFGTYDEILKVPGLLKITPEADSIEANQGFKIFVKNEYPLVLNNVKIVVEGVKVKTVPKVIKKLLPGEEVVFRLNIESPPQDTSFRIKAEAKEAESQLIEFKSYSNRILKVNQTKFTPVGEIIVSVEKFATLKYYFYLIPILLLIFIVVWRKLK
jgi:hypothetical protein